MKKKVKENYEQLAQRTGLRLDETGGALYGEPTGNTACWFIRQIVLSVYSDGKRFQRSATQDR